MPRLAWALGAILALSACAPLPPKDQAPTLNSPASGDFAAAPVSGWPAHHWWDTWQDPQLARLIESGLAHSPTMALARARVDQASAAVGGVKAGAGINTALDAQVSRQLYTANSIYPPPLGGSYANSGDIRLDLGYDFDFWGRNHAELEAALGVRAANEADQAGAAASLSSAIAKVYVQWQSVNQRIELVRQIESTRNELVQLEARRAKAGVVASDALNVLKADASAPKQTLVQLETQRDQLHYQLQALVGGEKNMPALQKASLPTVKAGLPDHLDVDLIARRADIAAARDRVQASLKQVDAARALFYPNINIAAFIGFDALKLERLLHSDSAQLGVTPALHLPLFDAGRLRANLDNERAGVKLAVAQYDQAIMTAVSEVNDAAIRTQGAERERESLERQRSARERDLTGARQRLHAGLTDKREVLRNELTLIALQDAELARHTQAVLAYVDLVKALGGGYEAASASTYASGAAKAESSVQPGAPAAFATTYTTH